MKVTVKLFASLRKGRFDISELELPDGLPVVKVLEALHVPVKEAAIIFVNGRHADGNHALKGGDILALFPPLGGG